MEWIKCSDRLPEKSKHVLCYYGVKSPLRGYMHEGKWYLYFYGGVEESYMHNVTHWMPLPEPPTE